MNPDIEKALTELPDLVATALLKWRTMTLEREKTEALLYLSFRAGEKKTTAEIEALVDSSDSRYQAVLKEITAEADYERLYERLLASKKLADLRTAF